MSFGWYGFGFSWRRKGFTLFMSMWKSLLGIVLGSLIFAVGTNYFLIANKLAEGGLTGVSIMVHYFVGWPIGVFYSVINIPLFVLSWRLVGRSFFLKSLFGVVMSSIFLDLTSAWRVPMDEKDILLAALYGGLSVGLGLGVIFYFGGSTGGADIIARILNRRFGYSLGRTLFSIDIVVMTAVFFLLGREVAMYTLIAVFVAARVVDLVQEGAYSAKAATIISQKADALVKRIMADLDRGVTILSGRGGYTANPQEVIYCVVNPSELMALKSLVREVDPKAFVIVSDVHEVLGEGFKDFG